MRGVWLVIDNGPVGDLAKVDQHTIAACESESDARAVAEWRLVVEKRLTVVREVVLIAEVAP